MPLPRLSGLLVSLTIGLIPTPTWAQNEFHYSGRDLPEDAVPRWEAVQKEGTAALHNGKLRVELTSSQRHFYGIGTWIDPKSGETMVRGDASAWNMEKGQARIELRFRCTAENPQEEVFRVLIRDGKRQWALSFSCTALGRKPVDTTDWDTYQIVIEQGLMRVASERQGVLLEGNAGSPDTRSTGLLFGSYSSTKDGSQQTRSWEVESIRWSSGSP